MNQIQDKENKIKFLQTCIEIYYKNSIKLITRRERDHYTDVQKYCEKLLKGIK
jgi:coproporphyrinogen III oxidase